MRGPWISLAGQCEASYTSVLGATALLRSSDPGFNGACVSLCPCRQNELLRVFTEHAKKDFAQETVSSDAIGRTSLIAVPIALGTNKFGVGGSAQGGSGMKSRHFGRVALKLIRSPETAFKEIGPALSPRVY